MDHSELMTKEHAQDMIVMAVTELSKNGTGDGSDVFVVKEVTTKFVIVAHNGGKKIHAIPIRPAAYFVRKLTRIIEGDLDDSAVGVEPDECEHELQDSGKTLIAFSVSNDKKSIAQFIEFMGCRPIIGPMGTPGYATAYSIKTARVLAQGLLDAINAAETGDEFNPRTILVEDGPVS